MHVRWKRVQLRSRRQNGGPLCPHLHVEFPTTLTPLLVNYEGKGKYRIMHRLGPSIRECCAMDPLATNAKISFWVEVDRRFQELESQLSPEELKDFVQIKAVLISAIEAQVGRVHHKTKEAFRKYRVGAFKERFRPPRKAQIIQRDEGTVADWCQTLGVDETITEEELRKVWRTLAMQHHPDRGGDPVEFIRYQKAYDRLKEAIGAR